MQFIDLAAQQKRIRQNIDSRIKKVLEHGGYVMGPEVAELEEALCAFTGARHCITCASGTDALLMTLLAWGIGPGDAVFVPAFTFFATSEMPALLGATPVFVDIDSETHNLRTERLSLAIKAVLAQDDAIHPLPHQAKQQRLRPRAIIPVDLFGQTADYGAILSIAQKYGLLVLEDAAQAFGATYFDKKACNLGCDAAATSFFPAKPLGCYGDGGAIFTDDDAMAKDLRSIRTHGKGQDKYDNVRIGLNGRMDTIQAAILLAKLEIFPEEIGLRQKVAACYARYLAQIPGLVPPKISEGNTSVWAQYCVMLDSRPRQDIMASLRQQDIPSNIYYPKAQHLLTAFSQLGYKDDDMPTAFHASAHILALPFHPYLEEHDIEHIASVLHEAMV